ncbi:dual specificity mitogen-activated protein kinase kinase 2-like isoform X5 [Paramacrobiotus metropolitanus]|uniref:dual specificity mitogen-activated protein kinase kinase 2-like isoform X5 n=1 Tax=Paramacrobiotus metropolitanus TaxID=2943436 RepID=UPI002445C41E|nr:dual specificity mitogen-activated protein kinase kinase 2-like isoform X5 [Paramacrobiotus metropolitanus]
MYFGSLSLIFIFANHCEFLAATTFFSSENLVSKRVKGVTFSYPESLDQAVPQMQSDERVSQAASQTTMQFHPDGPAYNVSAVDLEFLGHLDKGQYGSVNKYRHAASGYVMAVKVIKLTDDPEKMKCLRKDLEVNSDIRQRYGKCPYLVHSFGDLFWEGELWICMELMDTCLEKFYKSVFRLNQRLPEDVIAYIAYAVVHGLTFLKEDLDIMHRDVKPSLNELIQTRQRMRSGTIFDRMSGVSALLWLRSQLGSSLLKTAAFSAELVRLWKERRPIYPKNRHIQMICAVLSLRVVKKMLTKDRSMRICWP